MTRDSNFKRVVRARMDVTGETYMQARGHFRSQDSEPSGGGGVGSQELVLVVLRPVSAGQLRIHKTAWIGRDADNDLILHDPSVSRHHALIIEEGGAWLIRDLVSTNATRVNGSFIQEHRLQVGDQIELGRSLLEVRTT